MLYLEIRRSIVWSEKIRVGPSLRGTSDRPRDQSIEGANDRHRSKEKQEGRHFKRVLDVPVGPDVARRRFRKCESVGVLEVDDAILDIDRDRADGGNDPDDEDDPRRSL